VNGDLGVVVVAPDGTVIMVVPDGAAVVDGALRGRLDVENLGSSPHIAIRNNHGKITNKNGNANGKPRKKHGKVRNGG